MNNLDEGGRKVWMGKGTTWLMQAALLHQCSYVMCLDELADDDDTLGKHDELLSMRSMMQ